MPGLQICCWGIVARKPRVIRSRLRNHGLFFDSFDLSCILTLRRLPPSPESCTVLSMLWSFATTARCGCPCPGPCHKAGYIRKFRPDARKAVTNESKLSIVLNVCFRLYFVWILLVAPVVAACVEQRVLWLLFLFEVYIIFLS
jgi:hypothetical protein